MKPILAVMIGWRLMIDVPALTRRSFYRPLLRSLRLHATDGTLEHGFQQLPFCVTGTTPGPLTMQPMTATRIGAVTSFNPSVTALAS